MRYTIDYSAPVFRICTVDGSRRIIPGGIYDRREIIRGQRRRGGSGRYRYFKNSFLEAKLPFGPPTPHPDPRHKSRSTCHGEIARFTSRARVSGNWFFHSDISETTNFNLTPKSMWPLPSPTARRRKPGEAEVGGGAWGGRRRRTSRGWGRRVH